ncbi:hypothetical protein ACFQO8_06940 [Exiguobacterium aestuarii]|uniref:Uncharacterized protein n=1 Tax=Exiguobacterium aestuarii TaxID=273527 RepID=A0ABW2PL21_9BACL|nr:MULTISPECIES: hypothetical protein [Exiguobacterium]MCT4787013.1 hypothetical protein [Exiguobacterium aestuarii]
MNVHDLLRRYSIQTPVIYEKKRNGEWVKLERLPVYTILEVETNDQTIEAVAIDPFKAITVCRESASIEEARPYAVRIQIERP